MRSVRAGTLTLSIKYNFRCILRAFRQYDYFKAFTFPYVSRTLFKMIQTSTFRIKIYEMIQTSTFRIKIVSHFIIFLLFKCFPRFLSIRMKRHLHFNTTDVAVCVLVLLHLSHNITCATAVHIACAAPEVKFIRAALSL